MQLYYVVVLPRHENNRSCIISRPKCLLRSVIIILRICCIHLYLIMLWLFVFLDMCSYLLSWVFSSEIGLFELLFILSRISVIWVHIIKVKLFQVCGANQKRIHDFYFAIVRYRIFPCIITVFTFFEIKFEWVLKKEIENRPIILRNHIHFWWTYS